MPIAIPDLHAARFVDDDVSDARADFDHPVHARHRRKQDSVPFVLFRGGPKSAYKKISSAGNKGMPAVPGRGGDGNKRRRHDEEGEQEQRSHCRVTRAPSGFEAACRHDRRLTKHPDYHRSQHKSRIARAIVTTVYQLAHPAGHAQVGQGRRDGR